MFTILFEIKEGMMIALRAIRANKIRSVLTMLGIVIGVTSVILMVTAIRGIDEMFQSGMSSLGSDVLYVDKWAWFSNEPWWKMRNRRNITLEEYEEFKKLAKLPAAIAPTTTTRQTVKFGDTKIDNVFVNGSNEDYVHTTNFTFDLGRFYSEIEAKGSRYVAVLGSEIAKSLFPRGDALDKWIKIGGQNFKVIGVLEEQGSFILGSFNPDRQVFIPLGTVFKHFLAQSFRSITINVRAQNAALLDATKEEAVSVMRKVRGLTYNDENDFSINQQEGLKANIDSVVGVIQIVGLIITGLALFVGAIGIMNIMFVSVKERTREIGVRKAIGAKNRTILGQFLLESSTICLLGGLIGLVLAIILSMVVNQFLPTKVHIDAIILAISISLITGIIAGFAPAYTAAKLDPVDSLRYE